MKQIPFQFTISIAMIILFILISFPILSQEEIKEESQHNLKVKTHSGNEESSLNEARLILENAFDRYRKGDIDATKNNLKVATELLNKAAQNSRTEKAREESRNLAAEIDKFKGKINQASEQQENSLARFWHRATSIIKREADQLIHSYAELSTAEKTLKHLLDAKMHFFTAEHDLFVSHKAEDAGEELSKVLNYLDEAGQVAKPAIQKKVFALNKDIKSLKAYLDTKKGIWKNDSVIHALDKALKDLAEANKSALPTIKLRIELLKTDIHAVRDDVERSNIKNDYESAMTTLQNIINKL